MGLVARFLEESGFSTLILTMMPEYSREVGIPRIAAIEYPYGRPVGDVNDIEGQRKVLIEALSVFEKAKDPTLARSISSKKVDADLFDIEDIKEIDGIYIWYGEDINEKEEEIME